MLTEVIILAPMAVTVERITACSFQNKILVFIFKVLFPITCTVIVYLASLYQSANLLSCGGGIRAVRNKIWSQRTVRVVFFI